VDVALGQILDTLGISEKDNNHHESKKCMQFLENSALSFVIVE